MANEKIIAATGTVTASDENSGTLQSEEVLSGTISATNSGEGSVPATNTLQGTLNTLQAGVEMSGGISAKKEDDAPVSADLTLRVGQDGVNGKDGFSPTITVVKDTKTEYVLKVTNADGSYLTPNLIPDVEGLQDVETLVAGKVDKNLSGYLTTDPVTLSTAQRDQSYVYVNTYDGKFKRMEVGSFALQKEVDDRLRTKVQTVDARPDTSEWRVGDYIFLDKAGQEGGE
jgi:hypothetical protein